MTHFFFSLLITVKMTIFVAWWLADCQDVLATIRTSQFICYTCWCKDKACTFSTIDKMDSCWVVAIFFLYLAHFILEGSFWTLNGHDPILCNCRCYSCIVFPSSKEFCVSFWRFFLLFLLIRLSAYGTWWARLRLLLLFLTSFCFTWWLLSYFRGRSLFARRCCSFSAFPPQAASVTAANKARAERLV